MFEKQAQVATDEGFPIHESQLREANGGAVTAGVERAAKGQPREREATGEDSARAPSGYIVVGCLGDLRDSHFEGLSTRRGGWDDLSTG